ncbi:hypothetical protein SUGI_0509390 [Cryptomeria japonica]|uniref:uncharacterized protein LOC131028180 n=1 Tax=Cryptomeria japonica TaxID=3369 RepID=UPI002408C07F|nr:uncharacterized protein LOC131028180 [Cryptomeria japonica]GLJ26416.1 hypothetical protein SUGI_0509390 [Cryptomeria japonica]
MGGGAEGLLNVQPSSSIGVEYGKSFGTHDDLTLLEVDDVIFDQILDNRVTIRGSPDEEALLCTSSKTYAIKFVSTTNSVLLLPPQNFLSQEGNPHNEPEKAIATAIKLAPGHMELTHVAPKLEKLRSLLRQRPYKEEGESEMGNSGGLYRWEDLLENVQASEEELKEGLKSLAAVEIGGYWRIVDEAFMGCLLDVLILNSVQHDWPLNALRTEVVLPVLEQDGYSNKLALHCLETFGSRVISNGESAENGEGIEVWALSERLVCLHYAKQLLNAGRWKLDDFMEAWMQNLPSGMQAQMEMLRGEALVERFGAEMWVHPYSVSFLPTTPAERFAALFRERPRWEWQDLEPYIRDLRVPGLSAEGLLIKYTRRTQPTADATPVFSAR